MRKWNKFSRKTKLIPCVSLNFEDMQNLNTKLLIRNILRIKYGLNQDTKAFVSVARLAPEKGLDKTIDLFKNGEDLDKNILLIAGSGPLEKELKHRARGSKNIHFLGRLNRNEIFNLLVAGDIFVLLSRSGGISACNTRGYGSRKTNLGY